MEDYWALFCATGDVRAYMLYRTAEDREDGGEDGGAEK
ncbi:MAG: YqzL family protein [Oscillibacter sp.]|nr:YqzL family protein [Oscillibacter sp.]